ncbi:MAG: YfiM family protein [Betaproteobacteria bacterium]|nr:YfiM family protein [Betaproteobacteria bacterium]
MTPLVTPFSFDRCAVALAFSAAIWPSLATGLLPPTETSAVPARDPDQTVETGEPHPNLALRNTLIISTGVGMVWTYGKRQWWSDGFDGRFESERENWFGPHTRHGGADKLGHAYGNYTGVRWLTPLFEAAGNNRRTSLSLAAWSTLLTYSAVEVADGYSRKYRFSGEDFISNVGGTLFGLLMERSPRLDEILDFRFGYKRSSWESESDPFGDYSGQRYLLVVKADAFAALRGNLVTRYLEASAGYGVNIDNAGLQRNKYFGLGLNLSRLIADGFYGGRRNSNALQNGADRVFELVQFPSAIYARQGI